MRRVAVLFCAALLSLSLASSVAFADVVSLKLVSVGPGAEGGPNAGGGVYVYPYYFSINGSPVLVALVCDDYNHEVKLNETWQANTSKILDAAGGLTPLASPPGPTALTKLEAYKEAAWLFDQFGGHPTQANAAAINFAIWGLFSSQALSSSEYASSGAASWRNLADTTVPGLPDSYFDQFVVYTPIPGTQPLNCGLPQEYIGRVPEPGSLALLLSAGLLSMGLKKRS